MNKSLSRSREAQLTRVEQTIERDQEEPEKLRQQVIQCLYNSV